jgi:membrane protease YdiL (CAAX protease family)
MLLAEYADFPEWLRRTVFVFGVPWVRIAFELWVVKRVLRVTWRGALAHTGLSVFDRRQLGLALLVSVPVLVAALLPRWADHAEFAPVPTLIGRFAYLFLAVGLGEELAYRGILFRLLRTRWRFLPSALLSGLLFALPHVFRAAPWLQGPFQNAGLYGLAYAAFPLVMSFPLALMYERGGWSLWGVMLWHFAVDLRAILYTTYLYRIRELNVVWWTQGLILLSLLLALALAWNLPRPRETGRPGHKGARSKTRS